MAALRTDLLETLTNSFNRETYNAILRLEDGITPYIRYVHAEHERLEKSETTLAKLRQERSVLRGRSQSAVGK